MDACMWVVVGGVVNQSIIKLRHNFFIKGLYLEEKWGLKLLLGLGFDDCHTTYVPLLTSKRDLVSERNTNISTTSSKFWLHILSLGPSQTKLNHQYANQPYLL